MVIECSNCGYKNASTSKHCIQCGVFIGKPSKFVTKTESGQVRPTNQLLILIVLIVLAGLAMFTLGWVAGLVMIIVVVNYMWKNDMRAFAALLLVPVFILIGLMTFPDPLGLMTFMPLPLKTISLIGVTASWVFIINSLPEIEFGEKPDFSKVTGLHWTIYGFALVVTFGWTLFVTISDGRPFLMEGLIAQALTLPFILMSIVLRLPLEFKYKMIGLFVCLVPLFIWLGYSLWVSSATWLGNVRDQTQNLLSRGLSSGSSSSDPILSMILNPKLAVQAQLKPASTKEITQTAALPSVAFVASGEAMPTSGCYNSSAFQIIGKVKNTGGEYIKDLKLTLERYVDPLAIDNPCDQYNFTKSGEPPAKICEFKNQEIPREVTVPQTCLIEQVPPPDIQSCDDNGCTVSAHTCFIDVHAETGYHATSRLEVEFIEGAYARLKLEKRQITLSEKASVTSTGPVDLSMGGFEQPVIYLESSSPQITLITSITNMAGGNVSYKSAYIYIPKNLLTNGKCFNSEIDDWECFDSIPTGTVGEGTELTDEEKENINFYIARFKEFASDTPIIGEYHQFDYDNSDELLNQDYAICFYKKQIKTNNPNIGTCTLRATNALIGESGLDTTALRKTILLRGDVLYTYNVYGSVSIDLTGCD